MIKTTKQSVAGEVYAIMSRFHIPYSKMYSKEFYDYRFVNRVKRMLWVKLTEYDVSITETADDYILEIKWRMMSNENQ